MPARQGGGPERAVRRARASAGEGCKGGRFIRATGVEPFLFPPHHPSSDPDNSTEGRGCIATNTPAARRGRERRSVSAFPVSDSLSTRHAGVDRPKRFPGGPVFARCLRRNQQGGTRMGDVKPPPPSRRIPQSFNHARLRRLTRVSGGVRWGHLRRNTDRSTITRSLPERISPRVIAGTKQYTMMTCHYFSSTPRRLPFPAQRRFDRSTGRVARDPSVQVPRLSEARSSPRASIPTSRVPLPGLQGAPRMGIRQHPRPPLFVASDSLN